MSAPRPVLSTASLPEDTVIRVTRDCEQLTPGEVMGIVFGPKQDADAIIRRLVAASKDKR